ncbi:MAG: hypothetical protein AVDCRST_MAG39-825, partial [uncultured Sphingomonadaceae bacterium]
WRRRGTASPSAASPPACTARACRAARARAARRAGTGRPCRRATPPLRPWRWRRTLRGRNPGRPRTC